MEILITNYHLSGGGGHTTYIKSLVAGASPGVSFVVACPAGSTLFSQLQSSGITVFDVEFPGKLNELPNLVRNAKRLRAIILENKFGCIHVNGSPDHRMVMLVLMTIPKARRPRVIFTKHNSFTLSDSFWTAYRFKNFCDVIILVCSGLESTIPAKIRRVTGLLTIENGVNTAEFRPVDDDTKARMRTRYGVPERSLVLVSCAGTARHKGWHFLAKAVADHPDITVLIIGKKPSESLLEELLGDLHIYNLRFTGHLDDVRPFLQMGDIGFVLSTAIETASFACREMLSAGLPVIVSDFGCLSNNVSLSSGWIVAQGSCEAVRKILPTIKNSNLRQMGVESRARAVQNFDIEQFRSQTYSVYVEVVKVLNEIT